MTVGKLKKSIANLPDDMEVGGSGHFGEILECYGVRISQTPNGKMYLEIEIKDAGQEPD